MTARNRRSYFADVLSVIILLLLLAATAKAADSFPPLVPEGEPYEAILPILRNISERAPVNSVAFSPDGKTLASGSWDRTVRIWDLATKRETARLQGHTDLVYFVAFAPDGKTLVSGSRDKTVRVWDLSTHHERVRLEGHTDSVYSVAFSLDGKSLASGSGDKTVRVWDLGTQLEIARLEKHTDSVTSVAFSPDGKTMASGSYDNTVGLWDLDTQRETVRLQGHTDLVYFVAFSPDGKTLVSGSRDKTVRVWDLRTQRERVRLEGHTDSVYSVAFSLDGKSLASGSGDKTVRVWDLGTQLEIARLEKHTDSVTSVAFSPDGKTMASGSYDKTVRLWDLSTQRERARLESHTSPVATVGFSPDGKTLASGSGESNVRLWNLTTQNEVGRLEGHTNSVDSLAFSSDGRTLASGFGDNTVLLWDLTTRHERARLEGHTDSVYCMAFSQDGKTLASGSGDDTVRLWDLSTQRERVRLEGHTDSVYSVAFSPDGKILASGSRDKTVHLWDWSTQREMGHLEGHSDSVNSVAFSPNGKILASGSDDKTVRLWDLATRRTAASLKGHPGSVNSVSFSPDGKTLAAGSRDGVVLWDRIARKRVGVLVGGARGTWVWCSAGSRRCWRGDDGTLLVARDELGRLSAYRPPGEAQQLEVSIDEPYLKEVIAGDVLEISALVRNRGTGRAYWLAISPLEDCTGCSWVFDAPIVPFLDPGKVERLTARIHLHTWRLNPRSIATVIPLVVRQAYGEPTDLPPLRAKVIPPELELREARLLREGEKQVLVLTLQLFGAPLARATFRLNVHGQDSKPQPAEITERGMVRDRLVVLSFSLSPELEVSRDLKVDLAVQKFVSPLGPGLPAHEWEFRDIPVIPVIPASPSSPWMLYGLATALMLVLAALVHYQRVYRHPLVVRLTASPEAIRDLDIVQIGEGRRALERARRLNDVLVTARVTMSWLDHAAAFQAACSPEECCQVLSKRFNWHCEGPLDENSTVWKVDLGDDFPLNQRSLNLCFPDADTPHQDVLNRLASRSEVSLIIGATPAQRQLLAMEAPKRSSMLVAPDGFELTRLLLAENPVEELARILASHMPLTQLSPYQTGAGVAKQSLFFGRGALIARVMERDPCNYLVVGGRQVGKSSMLKELERRYANHPDVVCLYVVLADSVLMKGLGNRLGMEPDSPFEHVLEHLHKPQRQRHLLLIDEADAFVLHDRQQGYEKLQSMRAVSEEGHAHFILAGFWALYEQAVLDYQSPLMNFGSVLTVGPLERDACRKLATEPMEWLNIRWESEDLVQKLIEQVGQRANLITIACDELICGLGERERIITAKHLDGVLSSTRMRGHLSLLNLSTDAREQVLDRLSVYAAAGHEPGGRDRFTPAGIITRLERHGFTPSPEELKRSLARLELACVFGRAKNEYFFQVPLQRDLVLALDTDMQLRTELKAARLA